MASAPSDGAPPPATQQSSGGIPSSAAPATVGSAASASAPSPAASGSGPPPGSQLPVATQSAVPIPQAATTVGGLGSPGLMAGQQQNPAVGSQPPGQNFSSLQPQQQQQLIQNAVYQQKMRQRVMVPQQQQAPRGVAAGRPSQAPAPTSNVYSQAVSSPIGGGAAATSMQQQLAQRISSQQRPQQMAAQNGQTIQQQQQQQQQQQASALSATAIRSSMYPSQTTNMQQYMTQQGLRHPSMLNGQASTMQQVRQKQAQAQFQPAGIQGLHQMMSPLGRPSGMLQAQRAQGNVRAQQQQQQQPQQQQPQQQLTSPQRLQSGQVARAPSPAQLAYQMQTPLQQQQQQQPWSKQLSAAQYQHLRPVQQLSPQQFQQQQQQQQLRQLQRPLVSPGANFNPQAAGTPAPVNQPPEPTNRILGKRSIQELVTQVDAKEKLEPEVEDALLEIADDFIETVTTFACALAKHRKSTVLEAKDVLLHLERNWRITLPGFGGEEYRTYKKPVASDVHKQRLAVIKKSQAASPAEPKAAIGSPPGMKLPAASPIQSPPGSRMG